MTKSGREKKTWVAATAVLVFSACAGEIDPESITASVRVAGRFELEAGGSALAEETTRIGCALGTLFGVDYVIETQGARFGGVLPIEFRWIHPELAVPSEKLWGTETRARPPQPELAWGESKLPGRALWHLEHPEELKQGRYEFVIRVVETGEVLLSQAFDVEGC